MSLEALTDQVHADLSRLAHGADTWVRPRRSDEGHVYEVVIVGGGQSGLGAAFALMRERVSNILVIDENPAGYEGPWDTYARMLTLRTPKHLTAIDLGIPSLTFRAYWEALHGADGWAALDKIPRCDWMAYLRWYRQALNLPVVNGVKLIRVEPLDGGLYRLQVDGGARPALLARKVVLATGIQGGGEWYVPPMIASKLPRTLYAHTSKVIDFEALKGKRIGILGGGASAFDNAQFALSTGVAEAHVFMRRKELPRVNPIRQMEASGMIACFGALNDADKYAVMSSFLRHNQPPTNDTFQRALAKPGFELHLGAPWQDLELEGDVVRVTTPAGRFDFDFLVISTGLVSDPGLRPELNLIEEGILRWRDRYVAPSDVSNAVIDAHPYLSEGFAFKGRDAAAETRLHGLFAFNYSALISLGLSASAISGLKYAIPKLVKGVIEQLFLDDRDAMLGDYYAYAEPEFVGEWPPVKDRKSA